jgi:hypothetical protein
MSYEFIMLYRCIYSLPHTISLVCSAAAIGGHSMCIDLWFDRRIRAKGGSTIAACAAVLLCTFALRLP